MKSMLVSPQTQVAIGRGCSKPAQSQALYVCQHSTNKHLNLDDSKFDKHRHAPLKRWVKSKASHSRWMKSCWNIRHTKRHDQQLRVPWMSSESRFTNIHAGELGSGDIPKCKLSMQVNPTSPISPEFDVCLLLFSCLAPYNWCKANSYHFFLFTNNTELK